MNTAARMNRLFSALLLLGLCVGVIADEYNYERTKNIVYKEIDGETLKLDAYIPEGDGPFPAILVVHGGAWRLGSKGQLAMYARSLATTDRDELASGMYEKFEHAKVPGTTARRCDGDILG